VRRRHSFIIGLIFLFGAGACAPMLRPKREAADAIMNAKGALDEAQKMRASRLAPVDYREARETLLEAQDQYKHRRFGDAREMAELAQQFAENAIARAATAAKAAPKKKPKKKKPAPRKPR